MQNNRFVVLTGHLSNYPLSDLVGILRHQRKSGRLMIEYAKGPATFFFQNGELIDARMNDLSGLQAICVALAQPEASFNFNPLIQSPRRSIDPSLQRAVSELFGCWDESALQIEGSATSIEEPAALPPANTPRSLSGRRSELLALPPGPASMIPRRVFITTVVVLVVGLSTVIAVTGGFKGNPPASTVEAQTQSAPVAAPVDVPNRQAVVATAIKPNRPTTERREEKRKKEQEKVATEQDVQTIKVVMQIENGRVLRASVANHRPGMDGYEAMALRIARQRRFPPTLSGGETVIINVSR